jgi:hypothetical protein
VCGDERRIRDPRHVLEPGAVQVREVDEDSEAVARAHERLPVVGQAGTRVGRGGVHEGHARRIAVRAAPREAERAQAAFVPRRELVLPADRLRALEVQHREDAVVQDQVLGRAGDAQ